MKKVENKVRIISLHMVSRSAGLSDTTQTELSVFIGLPSGQRSTAHLLGKLGPGSEGGDCLTAGQYQANCQYD